MRARMLCLALVLGAAACSSGSSGTKKPVLNDDVTSLAHKACGTPCTGTLEGAPYKVEVPATWNGTLLLWSHGYRNAAAAPPDFAAPDRSPDDAPDDATATQLLAQGYALAGSAYASNGWAVQDGVKAGEQLQAWFTTNVGKPRRTYVWGASLGGLITELISEKHPEWVTGAAPECGAVAGTTENLDGALAIAYLVKTLIDPSLKITDYASPAESVAAFQKAQKSVVAAAQDVNGGGTAKVVAIATIARLAAQTKTYDGHDAVSQISAKVEDILTAMGFATFGQQEFATRVGGQGLDITGFDFAKSVTSDDRTTVGAYPKGDLDAYLAALKAGVRPDVDPAARAKAKEQGETTGRIAHPTITLHDEQDPLVVPQNERVLGDRVFANKAVGNLVQLFTKPPATYSDAPYGAGHCTFTTTEQVGLVTALDHWVRTGARSTPTYAATVFAQPTGLDTSYYPAPFALTSSS
ncbi:MAG: hypothetical protein JWO22_195 [Frankiales bacterium]|nr:hypothetical protein [Frankiales bacterium]